jgi:hypothetical protein
MPVLDLPEVAAPEPYAGPEMTLGPSCRTDEAAPARWCTRFFGDVLVSAPTRPVAGLPGYGAAGFVASTDSRLNPTRLAAWDRQSLSSVLEPDPAAVFFDETSLVVALQPETYLWDKSGETDEHWPMTAHAAICYITEAGMACQHGPELYAWQEAGARDSGWQEANDAAFSTWWLSGGAEAAGGPWAVLLAGMDAVEDW